MLQQQIKLCLEEKMLQELRQKTGRMYVKKFIKYTGSRNSCSNYVVQLINIKAVFISQHLNTYPWLLQLCNKV